MVTENDGDTHQGPLVSAAGISHTLFGLLVCLQRHSLINRHGNFQTVSHFIIYHDLPIARTIGEKTESAVPVCPAGLKGELCARSGNVYISLRGMQVY